MKFPTLLLPLLLSAAADLSATPATPATPATWTQRITPDRPSGLPRLPPTELGYTLSWKGMVEAGEFTIRLGKADPTFPRHYVASVHGGSKKLAAVLYPYRFAFTSLHHPGSGRPVRFTATETDQHATTKSSAVFSRNAVRSTAAETPHGSALAATEVRDLKLADVHDLFSALLHVRDQTLKSGESIVLVSHPVHRGYLISIQVLGREKLAGRDAIKLSVAMERIEPDLSLRPYKKLKSATLWLSDDQYRIPLELRTQVFIGDVRMSLKSWQVER